MTLQREITSIFLSKSISNFLSAQYLKFILLCIIDYSTDLRLQLISTNDLQNPKHIFKLWTLFKNLCFVTKFKDLDERFAHFPEKRQVVYFPSEMMSINLETFKTLREIGLWYNATRIRMLEIEKSLRCACKDLCISVKDISYLCSSK